MLKVPPAIRKIIEQYRQKQMLRDALKQVSACSDAMGPVKKALEQTVRVQSGADRRFYSAIDARWRDLSNRTDAIRLLGDSVPPHLLGQTVGVAEHTTNSSTTRPWGDLLYHLMRVLQPHKAIELGTCVGLSGSYIASGLKANNKGHLWTLEGMPDSVRVANETFSTLGLSDRVTTITGKFADTLDDAVKNGPFNFAFIDGHHEGPATIDYFTKIRPHLAGNSVVIFDDIDWSRGMQDAWNILKSHKDARDHVAIMGWGVLII
jgi:predicted O-methyltransferase YrrM